MNGYPGMVIGVTWIVFLVFWLISSFTAKKIARREGRAGIARRVLTGFVGYFLFFRAADPGFGVLSHRFLPDDVRIASSGAVITALGVLVAIWARIHIGKYWSATVALKSDHQLIRTGPYARVRHPIYTGILLALAGTAVAIGCYAALVGLAIYLAVFWIKARKEETLLVGEFGPAFEEHRRSTGFFLPKLFAH
ncbi:MAG: methyltransferase family protein [Candidatus Acidiferrales bacterium]